ncbi:protein SUPPRESSOR OF QUENCHING 1, chloroplastic [Neltuma alba]|uniref:protein SUPPRESSOR OF QUENCHING 1, chloroplastic n=1 Tax=Neltuma alba TaxID=207710 RepID=UPI0010A4B274|nr:protein SUPPRESSOR OF QUENCHING 1, chloroplastic [Prosopis alba]XP_028779439.1 protein SUPPRESSOR OF QUENCHING 1, chloroplastic [Prosopis alba]
MASKTFNSSLSRPTTTFLFPLNQKALRPISLPLLRSFHCRSKRTILSRRLVLKACVNVEEKGAVENSASEWGKVSAVLFDMDGVLCNSEIISGRAAVDVFAELGVQVTGEDFIPFRGTGEANFLGAVASLKGVKGFDTEAAKKRFYEIYLDKYAKPESAIGFPGALELISQCKEKGLKVAVASSADRVKVNANLAAAALPPSLFDAILSADAFEKLKPAPDMFLAASRMLNVPPSECIVIEDALAGVQAAKAAQMRCIAVRTTLSDEALESADPTLIRDDIGSVSLDDILSGGSIGHNKRMQGPQSFDDSTQTSTAMLAGNSYDGLSKTTSGADGEIFPRKWLQGSRRDVMRFGSLGIAISCLVFAVNNWKAMQYASPKAIWNLLFGVSQPSLEQNEGRSRSDRIQQFMNYIADLEARGNAQIVPEFPPKLDWLNTSPLQFGRDLRGKVVLLDFWTYCCINCMHVLPDLDYLEKKYKNMPFVVVGVHSAKFDNEKDSEAIRNAVLRYDITHPVVNDGDMYLWRKLGINSWPTFAIIGPNGNLLAQISGEGRKKDLDDFVEAALLFYGKQNMLDNKPLTLSFEKDNDPRLATSPLKFPGKLAIDVLNDRLFISDSNHNRIVVTDLDGNFVVQVGSSGEEGFQDGSFDGATFNRPQGLAYNAKQNILYVADTENHALREIDFVNEKVRTLAGNGTKGSDYSGGGKGAAQLLNSPWDLCFHPVEEKIYIAMAGQHQIWEHNLLDGITKAFSGDGYERNLNGSSSSSTSFAQPSGISLSQDQMEVYIADSESSSIRAVDLKTGGSRLLAGGDPIFPDNLFKFGDHDGVGSEVLLQHPLAVLCAKDGQIYITDSYNHKIKKLDPATKRVSTIVGTGKAGFRDGKAVVAQLSEPSGIVEGNNGRLFIADTNNSLIRYLDLNNGSLELHTLELKGFQPPSPKSRAFKRLRRRSSADTVTITTNGVSSNEGRLSIHVSLPNEYHFSKEARSRFSVDIEPEDAVNVEPRDGFLDEGSATLHFQRSSTSSSMGRINCKIYYCKEDEVCLYQSLQFEVPFREAEPNSAPADVTLSHLVKPKASASTFPQPVAP